MKIGVAVYKFFLPALHHKKSDSAGLFVGLALA